MIGSNSASYVYDAFGQRVRSTINSVPYDFIYKGRAAVDEVTSSGWLWGDAGASKLALYANGTTYFNHTDWLGSIRAWSNMSGSSIGTCTNLPFGDGQNCTGTSPNSWHYTGFTGLPYDSESGLAHALFRQLSYTQGRWISPDPSGTLGVDRTNPQSWNRYVYALNGPLNSVDPWGLSIYDCVWYGGCNAPCNSYCSGGGGGGGGGGGSGYYGGDTWSYGIYFVGPLWNQEAQDEARHLSIISVGYDPAWGDPCVYLNDSGTAVEPNGTDYNSNPDECKANGGMWVKDGYLLYKDSFGNISQQPWLGSPDYIDSMSTNLPPPKSGRGCTIVSGVSAFGGVGAAFAGEVAGANGAIVGLATYLLLSPLNPFRIRVRICCTTGRGETRKGMGTHERGERRISSCCIFSRESRRTTRRSRTFRHG